MGPAPPRSFNPSPTHYTFLHRPPFSFLALRLLQFFLAPKLKRSTALTCLSLHPRGSLIHGSACFLLVLIPYPPPPPTLLSRLVAKHVIIFPPLSLPLSVFNLGGVIQLNIIAFFSRLFESLPVIFSVSCFLLLAISQIWLYCLACIGAKACLNPPGCCASCWCILFCSCFSGLTCVPPSENGIGSWPASLCSCRCNSPHILQASEDWLASPLGVSCLDSRTQESYFPPPCTWLVTRLLFFVFLLLHLPGEHDERGCGTGGTRLRLYMSGREEEVWTARWMSVLGRRP